MTIPVMLLPFKSSYILHGGAFIADGKCHLFIGPGHIGKSTLALEAWRKGYDIVGDDYLLLDLKTTTVGAVPKPLKLRLAGGVLPERLEEIVAPRDYCLGYARDWTLVLSRSLPRMTALHRKVPIASIQLLVRTADKTSSCNPVDKHQFLQSIYQQLIAAPRNNLDIFKCLSPVFRDGRVSALHIGRMRQWPQSRLLLADFEKGGMSVPGPNRRSPRRYRMSVPGARAAAPAGDREGSD